MGIPLTARAPVPFTPPALRARIEAENAERIKIGEPPRDMPEIKVRVPTPYERDNFAAELVRGGVVHYNQEQIRDLFLAGIAYLHPRDKFDEMRADIEALWQASDSTKECHQKRADRAADLLERAGEHAVSPEEMEAELAKIQPDVVIDEAERVRLTAYQQDIVSRYAPLQKAFADLAEQNTKRDWLCVEMYVVTWTGLEHTPDGNGRGGITRHEAEWLRSVLQQEAFDELGMFIFALHSIDGDEEKNLASLIASFSDQTGLLVPSMETTVSESGSSTDENISPTPDSELPKTPEPSSGSTKPAGKKTGRSKSTQMAAH